VDQPKQRDADRSRAAILDAAEALFAEHGFETVTMAQVGAAAGVSRGTPGYFFGTKEALYRVVVERAAATLHILAESLTRRLASEKDPAVRVSAIVDAFLALLTSRGALVRLIDRESAAGTAAPHAEALQASLDGIVALDTGTGLAALALCWFPVSHPAAARILGVDPSAPDFSTLWRPRVLDALGIGVGAPSVPDPAKVQAAPVPVDAPAAVAAPVEATPDLPPDPGPKKKKKKKKKKP
jgi:TetR/AcrR family transcriptional regulator